MKKLTLLIVIVLALQACSTELQTTTQKKDTKWELTAWPGKTLPTTAKATLFITGGNKIGGKSFCNTYGGTAAINGNAIKFSQVFGTKMFCKETAEAESKYLNDLTSVDAGTISGGKLKLMKGGNVILIYSKVIDQK